MLCDAPVRAQVTGDLLLLARYGDRVYTTPRDHMRLYGRTDVGWSQDGFSAAGRLEFDRSSDNDPLGGRLAQYESVTQRWAEWRDERVRLRVGHLHTILGNGLLHRS